MTLASGGWTWPIARVLEAHDADSLKIDVDQGFSTHAHIWIRLLDVRAPELNTAEGVAALNATRGWLLEHAPDGRVKVDTYRSSQPLEIRFRQSFTRYLGRVTSLDGTSLNGWLIERGYTDMGA